MTDKNEEDVERLVPSIERGLVLCARLVPVDLPDPRVRGHLLAELVRRIPLLELCV